MRSFSCLLLHLMKKYNLVPLLIFFVVSLVYSFPVLENISWWGQMDWDQFTFWNAVPRETILRYHQFPLWNPYVNGGNVLLAHPHSPFLSPLYSFVLFFGPIIGLKLEIIVHLIIGLFGMFLLSRYLGLNKKSSYLSSFIYMLNSMYVLHLTEGHTSWLTLSFVPWVFLYYLKSIKDTRQVLGAILSFALILLGGSVDVFNIVVLFLIIYTFFKVFEQKNLIPVKTLVFIFIGTFLLCAIKLFPMLEFIFKYPRFTEIVSVAPDGFPLLYKMLLGREQAALDLLSSKTIENMGFETEWHKYGAYVGVFPLVLFLIGLIKTFKTKWPLITTGFIFLFISMADKFPFNLWELLHRLPVYNSLSCPTRYMLIFVFCIALFSGHGLSFIEEKLLLKGSNRRIFWNRALPVLIVLFVLIDLYYVNGPIFDNAFRISPVRMKRENVFRQKYKKINFLKLDDNGEEICRSSQYPILLSNSGLLDSYEVIHVTRGNVQVASDPKYKGEVYLSEAKGRVEIEYFSPNKIVVDIYAERPGTLVVNQNYHTGWNVVRGKGRTVSADDFQGLIATPVPSGQSNIVFYYLPLSFLLGLCVSTVFVILMFFGMVRKPKLNIESKKS